MQKVEGSSPFSRSQKSPAQAGVFLCLSMGEVPAQEARVKPRVKVLQSRGSVT